MQNYIHNLPHLKAPGHVTQEKMYQIAETFHNADEGNKGFLTCEDLKVAFVSLFGYKPSKTEVEQLMTKCQKKLARGQLQGEESLTKKSIEATSSSPQLCMTLEHFTEIAKIKILAEDDDDEIRQMFLAFDTTSQGFITVDSAKKVFLQVAPFVHSVTVEKLFQEADPDRDGRVSYRDFEFIMKYGMDSTL